jgi:glutamyl-tRNA reductase
MNLLVVGCGHRTAPVAIRERLAVAGEKLNALLDALSGSLGLEAVALSTCNRLEVYVAGPAGAPDADTTIRIISNCCLIEPEEWQAHIYEHRDAEAVRHLFRVASSLDSMVIGEAQITGQVKQAYEAAVSRGAAGPVLHLLFQHASRVASRVRQETHIGGGHVSVSSIAVDYVRQVFDRFDDKTLLVIGAGKMSSLALRHLQQLRPSRIRVANRSPDRAHELAVECGGEAVSWDDLDFALRTADIVISSTGAPEPIVDSTRYQRIFARRLPRPLIILDLAVPRDFDPRIHDGERTCLFNIDDLHRIQKHRLQERAKHVAPAEAIVEAESRRFIKCWRHRKYGPIIGRLHDDLESKRQLVVRQVMSKLNGRVTDEDRRYIEDAFRLLQNHFLHGPITALTEEPSENQGHTLLEALRKLFGLHGETEP